MINPMYNKRVSYLRYMVGLKSKVNWEQIKENNVTFTDMIVDFLMKSGTVCMVAANRKEVFNKVRNPDAPFIVLLSTTDIQLPCRTNLCAGTSWMIFRRSEESRKGLFDREVFKGGRRALHSGILINGCNTMMASAFKKLDGIHYFMFDIMTGDFRLFEDSCYLRPSGNLLSINEALFYKFTPNVQAWLKERKAQQKSKGYYSRYTGGWLTDCFIILRSGGLLLSPEDSEFKDGRVKLLCKAVTMAHVVEKAGGKASNGQTAILKSLKTSKSQHTNLILGSIEEVDNYIKHVEPHLSQGYQLETDEDDTSTDLDE
ncbi:unnamed protein product [Nezara viridula]|uniref:Fructose-bisphosphatase n=1 Tax=Nezara viridula TaxID=85310 RepID=A0A9P0HTG9_NEZVI|nr:unnamed protein product [Nezara viridula]